MRLSNDISSVRIPSLNVTNFGSGNGFTKTSQFGPAMRVSAVDSRFFPTASGVAGKPSVRTIDAFNGGPGGAPKPFGGLSSWTGGF